MQEKSRHIRFRVEEPLLNFLKEQSRKRNTTISDTVRNLCTWMYVHLEFNPKGKNNEGMASIFSNSKRKKSFMKFVNDISK